MAGLPAPPPSIADILTRSLCPPPKERSAMTNVFTLDSLREEVKKGFEPFVLGLADGSQCELRSTLRLSAESRKTVKDSLDALSELDTDDDSTDNLDKVIELVSKVFYAVADKPAKLLADLQDSDKLIQVALMTRVLGAWIGDTEAGEA